MIFSGFEIGSAVMFPASAIEPILAAEPDNPVAAAYAAYIPMPYDRQCWDQTAVLHGVRPDAGYFDLSEPGRVTVDAGGYTRFSPDPAGTHRLLVLPEAGIDRARDAIIRLSTAFPAVAP